MVDEFVLFDDAQFTKRDWRNRNQIKTPDGLHWLTIPVEVKGKYTQKIKDTKISDPKWPISHWETIRHSYNQSRFFNDFKDAFEYLFLNRKEMYLSDVNYIFLETIKEILGIKTRIWWSDEFDLPEGKNEKLISICKSLKATHYLSGPAAKSYIDESLFNQEKIQVGWMDYTGYPEYKQLYPPFEHQVSILDLIFNEGLDAPNFMKSFI